MCSRVLEIINMKIILSRKGFDSANGGQPNPILPDGTLLSLPIPSDDAANSYSSLMLGDSSYFNIIGQLNSRPKVSPDSLCHLDPDLREHVRPRPEGWKPTFGQMGASLTELRNNGVGEGDLFLFFGWFRATEYCNGRLRYVKGATDKHIIYGYLQVGEVINHKSDVPEWLVEHPHVAYDKAWEQGRNALFIASDKLSFAPQMNGAGVFNLSKERVLTKEGYSRRYWDLPDCFREVQISHHPSPWENGVFKSVCIGQEFVMDATPRILDWAKMIIGTRK